MEFLDRNAEAGGHGTASEAAASAASRGPHPLAPDWNVRRPSAQAINTIARAVTKIKVNLGRLPPAAGRAADTSYCFSILVMATPLDWLETQVSRGGGGAAIVRRARERLDGSPGDDRRAQPLAPRKTTRSFRASRRPP
jgi:hypothetical protein